MQIDKIIYTKNKNAAITIDEQANVIVKIPINANKQVITKFIESKSSWIEKHRNIQLEKIERFSKILNYDSILLYGDLYKITYSSSTKEIIRLKDEIIFPEKHKDKIIESIKKYMKQLFIDIIKERVKYYETVTNIKCCNVSLSSSKSKWGSCSTKKALKFNFRLIMLKPELIDYVVLHELCHVKEMNHSSKFWNLMFEYSKDWKKLRNQLKQNSILSKLY